MNPHDQAKLDAIERDRRRREDELLLALLLLADEARNDAYVMLKHGMGPQQAIQGVMQRATGAIATAMADAYRDGVRRMAVLADETIPQSGPPLAAWKDENAATVDTLKTAFRQQAQDATDAMVQSIGDALDKYVPAVIRRPQSPELKGAVREAFDTAGYTATNPLALDLGAARAIVGAHNNGMFAGATEFPVVTGLRHVSVLDERTTMICRSRDGITLPLDDPYWLENSIPPLHWNALARGTMVRTARGPVAIEAVKIGALVWTHSSRWRRVYATMRKRHESKRIKALYLDTGRILRVTDEHPVLTSDGWKPAGNLNLGDVLFQHSHQVRGSLNAKLPDPKDFPALRDEESVSFPVVDYAASVIVALAINFNNDSSINVREVGNVSANRELEGERYASSRENSHQHRFPFRRCLAVRRGNGDGALGSSARSGDGISVEHPMRVGGVGGAVVFGSAPSPMTRARRMLTSRIGNAGLLDATSDRYSVSLAPIAQHCFPDTQTALDGPQGFVAPEMTLGNDGLHDASVGKVGGWHGATIISIVDEPYNDEVFNLAVEEDETYLASGLIVHNCRSVVLPVLGSFTPTEPRDVFAASPGFGEMSAVFIQRLKGFGGLAA